MQDERICSPPFMVLNTECSPDVLEQIKQQGLTFPFICKTRVAHGTNSHEMAIIFNEEDLKDVKPPCVIQSFINHNAVLYKVFVVGESYTVVERPSLKNFPSGPAGLSSETDDSSICMCYSRGPHANHFHHLCSRLLREPVHREQLLSDWGAEGFKHFVPRKQLETMHQRDTDRKAIFFNSHNVSKPESSSDLTSRENVEGVSEPPNDDVIRELSRLLREALGVSLFGIDVIINNQTGQHAVIDINAFPGYEGVPEFFNDLLNHITSVLQSQNPDFAPSGEQPKALPVSAAVPSAAPLSPACCGSMRGKELQRLGCNSAVSPNFQQHCVSTIATKASSQ
nr:inositol-tetrakisphosphate 1-kinase isoform X3 [Nothobranchius furzeri]